jgi:hypothetical protein
MAMRQLRLGHGMRSSPKTTNIVTGAAHSLICRNQGNFARKYPKWPAVEGIVHLAGAIRHE